MDKVDKDKEIPLIDIKDLEDRKRESFEMRPSQKERNKKKALRRILSLPDDLDDVQKKIEQEDKPDSKIVYLFDALCEFEAKYKENAGIYYFSIGILLISATTFFCGTVFPTLSKLEFLFVSVLTGFLMNYYLVRIGNITPYVEEDEGNFKAKQCAIAFLLSITCLIYAEKTKLGLVALLFWLLAFVISGLMQICCYGEKWGKWEIFGGIVAIVGSFLILVYEENIQTTYRKGAFGGIIACIISVVLLVYSMLNIKMIKNANVLTINHIHLLIIVLFIPVFFSIDQITSPKFNAWFFMIIAGLFIEIAGVCIVRAIQLERPSVLLVYFNLAFVVNLLGKLFVNHNQHFLAYVGIILIIFGLFVTAKDSSQLDKPGSFYLGNTQVKQVEELKLYR